MSYPTGIVLDDVFEFGTVYVTDAYGIRSNTIELDNEVELSTTYLASGAQLLTPSVVIDNIAAIETGIGYVTTTPGYRSYGYPYSMFARSAGDDTVEIVFESEDPLSASFVGSPTTGLRPVTVTFTSSSSGPSITGYLWNFGDGYGSTEENPVHTYTVAGVYTVSFTAQGPFNSATETKLNYITITNPTPPPSGIAKGIYQLVLSNKNRYPYKIGYDTMISKVDVLQNRRMSFLKDANVELWLNYEDSWIVYESGLTNREGSVYLNHSGMTRSGISNCLGIARATINGRDYVSNVIRYNFR